MSGAGMTGPPAAGGRARGWLQNNKTMAIAAAAVMAAAAGLALYHKHQVTKAAATATPATTSTTGTSTYDTSATDAYNTLEQQITALQNNQTTTTTTPPPTTTAPPPVTTPPPSTSSPPPATTPPPGGTSGGPPATSPTATWTYTVESGDNLSSIAARNPTPVTLATLLQMNPVYTTNPKYQGGNLIFAGDHVVLPGSGPLK